MPIWSIVVVALLVLWIIAHMKTSRADGEYIGKMHPYRRIMFHIMPTRTESVVFFDTWVRADRLLEYREQARKQFDCDVTHMLVAAVGKGLTENPEMNKFVVGRRLYQRKERFVTFSMKRKSMDKKAKLAVVKIDIRDGETFAELCARIDEKIDHQRSGKRTYEDKEFDFFNLLPRPVLASATRLFKKLDEFNLLPPSFIRNDGLYTSCFVANLGSLGMGPGYHHLYEWGNCPVFLMTGRIEERPVVEDGQVVVRPMLQLRWTYDERIDDGLTARHGMDTVQRVLEDPFECLGCLERSKPEKDAA